MSLRPQNALIWLRANAMEQGWQLFRGTVFAVVLRVALPLVHQSSAESMAEEAAEGRLTGARRERCSQLCPVPPERP